MCGDCEKKMKELEQRNKELQAKIELLESDKKALTNN